MARAGLPEYVVLPAAPVASLSPASGFPEPATMTNWHRSLGDATSSRFSALNQIRRENVVLRKKLLHFNGGLFADDTVLPINGLQLGLLKPEDASIESYVTQKTLDGLYLMMAQEERAIRKDPLGQASSLLKKVFGAVQ